MKIKNSLLILSSLFFLSACGDHSGVKMGTKITNTVDTAKAKTVCSDNCEAKNNNTDVSCKLTSEEMQKRKSTVLESLRKQTLEKKELPDGYAFKFNGTDKMFDELTEFIKTERACCDFFTFDLSVSGDKNEIWMSLTGPKEAKDMIRSELEL